MLSDILALISVICFIPLLGRLINIFPTLVAGLTRWKESVNMQMSLKLRTDRDLIAVALIIPFCLTAYKFRLYDPDFISGMRSNAGLGTTIGIFVAYLMLRTMTRYIFRLHRTPSSTYAAATGSANSFFIILCLTLLLVGGVLPFFGTSATTVRTAMFWLSGGIYALYLLRKMQIFLSSCNFLVSFLYLCALEILPTGVLIASAVIF